MNELNPTAGPIPPAIATPPRLTKPVPLGEDPADREPIPGPLVAVEAIFRAPRRIMYQLRQPGLGGRIMAMLMGSIFCSLIYWLVVGAFFIGTQIWVPAVHNAVGVFG